MRHRVHSIKGIWAFLVKQKCLLLILTTLLNATHICADTFDVFKEPCLFVTLTDEGVDAYPLTTIDGLYHIEGDSACITLLSGKIAKYHKDEYKSIGTEIPILPYMTSFKFNNKYNPNLNQDVVATTTNEVINLKINAIGKSLTASFQLSDSHAIAYIGNELQTSKESRNRFDKSIEYTVTYPRYNVISGNKKQPFGRIYTINTEWLTDEGKVARIDIDIEKGYTVTSKNYYLDAILSIKGYGVYDDFIDSVQIKGRGNNSWNYKKKSYRLKFHEKVKPFGLTKGKSWVLLSNPQHGSLMVNAIAMKIGQMIDVPYTNHIIPVELYINDEYQGSYIFTEKIGFSNNSVDADEERGYMLELDRYYDEDFKFYSAYSKLPVNVKEPELLEEEKSIVSSSLLQTMLNDNCLNTIPSQKFPNSSPTAIVISNHNEKNAKFKTIKEQFNQLDKIVCNNGDLSKLIDLDAAARFILANDLAINTEILHPKSTFLWKEDMYSKNSKFIFGPIWDFDYAFGYVNKNYFFDNTSCTLISKGESPGHKFFTALRNNKEFQRHYYKVWCEFVENDCTKEIMEYISDYYNFVKESYKNNAKKWGDNTDYCSYVPIMQQWIEKRVSYIVKNLTKYDITDLIDESPEMLNKERNNSGVYTVYGERVTNTENLKQGLYIIDGKKVFIKGN